MECPRIVLAAVGVAVDRRVITEIALRVGMIRRHQSHLERVVEIAAAIENARAWLEVDQFRKRRHAAIVKIGCAAEDRLQRSADEAMSIAWIGTQITPLRLQRMTGREE